MKAVQFDAVSPPVDPASAITEQRLYSVLLGNGIRAFFGSDRHARQYNASAERFLNDALFRGNLLLAELYPMWRMAWLYLDKLPARERDASSGIHDAEAAMDRSHRRRGGPDYIHHAWKDVTTAMVHLRGVVLVLVDLYRHKGHGVERQRLELMLGQVNALLDELRTWGGGDDAPNAIATRKV